MDERERYKELLSMYLARSPIAKEARKVARSWKYDNPGQAYNVAFLALNPVEQETAMAYSLGIMLWCIFEGVGSPRNNIWASSASCWDEGSELEFPEFRRTPVRLRALVEWCVGGVERCAVICDKEKGIIRKGDRVYPRDRQIVGDEGPEETRIEVETAAK